MLASKILELCSAVLTEKLGSSDDWPKPVLSQTKKEFEGDYTLVVFPYVRFFKQKPEEVAEWIGNRLVESSDLIQDFNVVKGFLNISVQGSQWHDSLRNLDTVGELDSKKKDSKVLVEFCSPNTNKPIHLGHIRNILLGWSTYKILDAVGYDVVRTQIINDRGIAICKSMLAWQKFGEGKTPESTGRKGDFFVGDYYVLFEQKFQEEYKSWQQSDVASKVFEEKAKDGISKEEFFKKYKHTYFNEFSALGAEAKEMLREWEAKNPEVYSLWQTMNQWVYDGFEVTYDKLGIAFDSLYYESDTYLKGKEMSAEGLEKGIFFKKDDGSVWADLTDEGMDQKIILREDGTALYITQDLGTAQQRYEDHNMDGCIYVVADEQDYHFQVLFKLLGKLGRPFADGLKHLSYGMVDLPTGKMKSREGNVVDADDLVEEIIGEAARNADERGELDGLSNDEIADIHRKVGLGALKFFILKVNPRKRMTFNPAESLDMQGQTGPYIQNAYVRIASVLRKNEGNINDATGNHLPSDMEKSIIRDLLHYPEVLEQAAQELDPSHVANYAYGLAKDYHKFYHDHRILTAETPAAKSFRLLLSLRVQTVIRHSMDLLGIEMPEKM